MPRLGCLEDQSIFITGQCGSSRLTTLENVTDLTWDRRLDDVSAATVVVPVGGGLGGDPCCEELSKVEPWCHELHIFRNGEEVWAGVISRVTYGYAQVTIEARDMLAWLAVRIPECPFSVDDQEISTVAQTIITLALADGDPCISEFLQVVPTVDERISFEEPFAAFDASAYDQLVRLTEVGLSFTALGRRIVVGGQQLFDRRIGLLTDEHILGEIEVVKDGSLYANRAFTHYGGDDDPAQCAANLPGAICNPSTLIPVGASCPAVSEIVDGDSTLACYGRVERLLDVGDEFGVVEAKVSGDIYVAAGGKYVPRILEFPSGTRLSPDTPFGLNEMVPGMNVDVAFTGLCLDIFEPMRLIEVVYRATPEDEEISVTLSSRNIIEGGLNVAVA